MHRADRRTADRRTADRHATVPRVLPPWEERGMGVTA